MSIDDVMRFELDCLKGEGHSRQFRSKNSLVYIVFLIKSRVIWIFSSFTVCENQQNYFGDNNRLGM